MSKFIKEIFTFLFIFIYLSNTSLAVVIKDIKVYGNERITEETIKLFSPISINDDVDKTLLNNLLKELYQTRYFKNVSSKIEDNILKIYVDEYP